MNIVAYGTGTSSTRLWAAKEAERVLLRLVDLLMVLCYTSHGKCLTNKSDWGSTMRKVTLYIAMSLDGYIADSNGNVDWLSGQGCDAENIDTYSTFIKDIDTVIMGWKTYHQVTTELSPNEWIYSELVSYIITHRTLPSTKNLKFVQGDPRKIVQKLKQESGRGIWICGGANIIHPLVQADLIDEYYISIIPTLLGSGIRLWGEVNKEMKLKQVRTQTYNGITELVYTRR